MKFQNRLEAAKLLARKLKKYQGKDVVVYALPRGGVVLGAEIAKYVGAPLDLVIPRKVGHPLHPEYAICAVTEDGYVVCNEDEASQHDPKWLKRAILDEQKEAKRRRVKYLMGRPHTPVKDKAAIIVDDGVATGLTMLAAIEDVKKHGPAKTVLAIPVLPADVGELLSKKADEIVALDIPEQYAGAVGSYYQQFDQVEDEEVLSLLDNAASV